MESLSLTLILFSSNSLFELLLSSVLKPFKSVSVVFYVHRPRFIESSRSSSSFSFTI